MVADLVWAYNLCVCVSWLHHIYRGSEPHTLTPTGSTAVYLQRCARGLIFDIDQDVTGVDNAVGRESFRSRNGKP